MKYKLYTDGAVSRNGYEDAVGGWAFVALDEQGEIGRNAGGKKLATNQQMELTAAIEGLKWIFNTQNISSVDEIEVVSDSAYLINCVSQKWYDNWSSNGWKNSKKQPVANKELWEQLIPYFRNKQVNWMKVKGHGGGATEDSHWNELVDKLAVAGKELNYGVR